MIPTVFAMRAFQTENDRILGPAGGNSSQYFLLDEKRGLVAESTRIITIEKPVLSNFTPQPGIPEEKKHYFARWVAHCFNRPAFPDEVVKDVIKPILDKVAKMKEDHDPLYEVTQMFKELRVAPLGNPPYDVFLVFIISEDGLPEGGELRLKRFFEAIKECFDPNKVNSADWDKNDLYSISVGQYMDTKQIYLDHHTYQGETIIGLVPPAYHM